jgi:hypothetical protein
MADAQLDEAGVGVQEERFSLPPQSRAEEPCESIEVDAQEIGTACYLCYGQCVNLGVQGVKGRPCSKGFTEIIDRRRRARSGVKDDRRTDG